MQQVNTEMEYHQRRLTLEHTWRGTQLELDQERRMLRRWWITAVVLIFLFGGGIAGTTYLNGNWSWLAIVSGVGILAYIVLFLTYGLETLKNSWKHRGEVVEIRNQQRILEDIWIQGLAVERYAEYYRQVLIPQIIGDYRKQSQVNRVLHLIFQMSVIVSSLFVTGLTSGLDVKLGLHAAWVAPVLSVVVSLFTAIMGFFKFRERSFHMQQTADSIEQEKTALELGIRHYKTYNNDPITAFAEFAERVEHLREEQHKREQQLEQSSEGKEASAA